MIIDMKSLSMTEASEIAAASSTEEQEIISFIKRFVKLNEKDAKALRVELEELGLAKIKDEYLVKIIDLLPEDASDLNKIFVDVSLDEDEIHKILDITKKYG